MAGITGNRRYILQHHIDNGLSFNLSGILEFLRTFNSYDRNIYMVWALPRSLATTKGIETTDLQLTDHVLLHTP